MTLADARLYLVSPATLGTRRLADLIPELAVAGVDLLQLREKEMEAGDLLRVGAPIRDACRTARIPFIINDRPDVALALEADGVHIGQNDLPVDVTRRIVGNSIVGLSTHARSEIDAAMSSGHRLDYIAVGPVHATPTKPGRQGTGFDLVRYASEVVGIPWFVTGGMDLATLPEAITAGARRIVVVRALTDAADPIAAAAELRTALDAVSINS